VKTNEANLRGYRLELYRDPEDESWAAEVPDLPGCLAGGRSPAEAIDRAEDAIAAWIEAAVADGLPVPPPSPPDEGYSGRFVLRVAKGIHRVLARQAKREGVSLNTYCSNALTQAVTVAQFADLTAGPRIAFVRDHYYVSAGPTQQVGTAVFLAESAGQLWPMAPASDRPYLITAQRST
jgi:antitoxin HicB